MSSSEIRIQKYYYQKKNGNLERFSSIFSFVDKKEVVYVTSTVFFIEQNDMGYRRFSSGVVVSYIYVISGERFRVFLFFLFVNVMQFSLKRSVFVFLRLQSEIVSIFIDRRKFVSSIIDSLSFSDKLLFEYEFSFRFGIYVQLSIELKIFIFFFQ